MSNVQVQSKRNGLIVALPRDVSPIGNRFFVKGGDNEHIFEKVKNTRIPKEVDTVTFSKETEVEEDVKQKPRRRKKEEENTVVDSDEFA